MRDRIQNTYLVELYNLELWHEKGTSFVPLFTDQWNHSIYLFYEAVKKDLVVG